MVNEFNNGNLFKNIDVKSSFEQMSRGQAKTKELKGKSGNQLGGNNSLLKTTAGTSTPPVKSMKNEDFTLKKQDRNSKLLLNRVQVPPSMNPTPKSPPAGSLDEMGRDKSMVQKWKEHQETRKKLLRQGMSSDEVDKMGYTAQTFSSFKKNYEDTDPKEKERKRKEREKALAAYKLAGSVAKFNERGKVLTGNDTISGMKFNPNGSPIIYNLPTDVSGVDILMFSDDWQRIMNAAPVSDAEAQLMVDRNNARAMKEVQRQERQKLLERKEEERKIQREKAILDYSAKVSGGFIEVKIGEDVVAMRDAWKLHWRKR